MISFVLLSLMAATFEVEAPAYSQSWKDAPVRFLLNDLPADAQVRVLDTATGLEVPAKIQQHRRARYVYWLRSDDATQTKTYTIDTGQAPAMTPVFVGAGDMLAYGRDKVEADLGVGLWATAMPICAARCLLFSITSS